MDTGVYSKLTDPYGFDLEVSHTLRDACHAPAHSPQAYYASLIDCYLNGNSKVDMTATTHNGQIPPCFYNVYVRSGYWSDDSTMVINLYFDDI